MEEMEVPTEHLHEQVQHAAEHGESRWLSGVALSSALLAIFAAVSSLLSAHHSDEAVIARIEAADLWAHYQSKSMKGHMLENTDMLLSALGHPLPAKEKTKLAAYETEKESLAEKAAEKEKESSGHLRHHSHLARAVTLFQIAIAIGAISALSRRKALWHVSSVFGLAGLALLAKSLLLG